MSDGRPATVIPFYALRLGHLIQAKADLVVTCDACRRVARLPVIPLACKRGPNYGVRDLERGLRCETCGMRGWASIRVEWL